MRQQRAATIHAGNKRRRRRRRRGRGRRRRSDIQAPREARTPGCGVAAGSALRQCLGGVRGRTVARAHPRVGQGGSRRHRRVATPVRRVMRLPLSATRRLRAKPPPVSAGSPSIRSGAYHPPRAHVPDTTACTPAAPVLWPACAPCCALSAERVSRSTILEH
jgi:hypothetical protein